MNPAMYIFLNKGLGMSTGKSAAQAAHAAVEAAILSDELGSRHPAYGEIVREWRVGLHYKKLVMEARDENHMRNIKNYLEDRGFSCKMIIDEGLTEIAPHQVTALGVQIVDKNDPHVRATFSTFELYKDEAKSERRHGIKVFN